MSVTPLDFLQSAKEFANSNSEINKRNGLSRAYYAAYHLSSIIFPLDDNFIPPNLKVGMHKKYISYLLAGEAESLQRKVGLTLNKLYTKRITADYDLDEKLRPDALALQIAGTDNIFKLLEPDSQIATSQDSSKVDIAT